MQTSFPYHQMPPYAGNSYTLYESSASSESEDDEYTMINDIEHDNIDRVIVARGVHLATDCFGTREKRQQVREPDFHKKPVYSLATVELAKKYFPHSPEYKRADEFVKNYFEILKRTPDHPEKNSNGKEVRPQTFESLYARFVQAYVNSYHSVILDNGMTRNFNFCSNCNPVISTMCDNDIYKTITFITNPMKSSNQFFPKLRTNGTFKHVRFGYMQIYAIAREYFNQYATYVDHLKNMGKISFKPHRHEGEVIFESSIPAEYILGYQVFSLPKFKKPWKEEINTHYGLNEVDYNKYRTKFSQLPPSQTTELITELMGIVTENKIKKLLHKRTQRHATAIVDYHGEKEFPYRLSYHKGDTLTILQKNPGPEFANYPQWWIAGFKGTKGFVDSQNLKF